MTDETTPDSATALRDNLPEIPEDTDSWNRPTIQQIDGFKDGFKDWASDGRAANTVTWYWSVVKNAPYISLCEESQFSIAGTLNKYLNTADYSSKKNVKSAISALLGYLFELQGQTIDGEDYERLRQKRNSIKTNLEVESNGSNSTAIDEETVKNNYIHPDDFVELLKNVRPERAQFWYLLYTTGMRIGELKRTSPALLKPNRGEHGAIYVPGGRGDGRKSPSSRDILFLSKTPMTVLKKAAIGDYTDPNAETWENVYFPDFTSQTEYYHMKQKWCDELGIGPRTVHSLRHTRLSHLVNDASLVPSQDVKEFVQKRAGHSSADMTDSYIATTFQRDPITLETYCDRNDIDIRKVIASEAN